MRLGSTLILLVASILCAAAWAKEPDAGRRAMTIKSVEHQRMMIGDNVIYEADVNVLDPDANYYWIEIGIDELTWRNSAISRSVGSTAMEQAGASDDHAYGWMVSYVIQDQGSAGSIEVDVVYSIRDSAKGIDRTEHVHADLEVGKRFAMISPSGAKVWLLVSRQ